MNQAFEILINILVTLLFPRPQKNRRTLCLTSSWNGFMIVSVCISRTFASNRRRRQWSQRSRWAPRGARQKSLFCTSALTCYMIYSVWAAVVLILYTLSVLYPQVNWKYETTEWVFTSLWMWRLRVSPTRHITFTDAPKPVGFRGSDAVNRLD